MAADISKLKKELADLKERYMHYLRNLRTGRANPTVFEEVSVEYYGQPVELKSLANVIVRNSLSVAIEPYNKADSDKIVESIQKANLGFNPINEGHVIRIDIPAMTEEKRKQIVDDMHLELENTFKKRVRQIRQDYIHKSEKQDGITEDEVKHDRKLIQAEIDSINKKLDELTAVKSSEVMDITKG